MIFGKYRENIVLTLGSKVALPPTPGRKSVKALLLYDMTAYLSQAINMLLELDHERTLHWYKKPFKGHFELKVGPHSQQVFSSLDVSRIKVKGTGTVNGKRVELSFVDDDLHYIAPVRVEGHEGEWGTFRGRTNLMSEPAVLKVHDGREYFLRLIEWNEFRLYTGEGRTVMTMFMNRVDGFVAKMDMRFENIMTEEKDYLLLATLVFWEVLFFNRQTS